MTLLMGCDPEFFVAKNGVLESAFNMIPGTKEAPEPVECGAVQVDGMALEFNIDPAGDENEFVHNIDTVLGKLREMIPPEYDFRFQPVADFGGEYISSQPLAATELGCEPDWNAYTQSMNPPPNAEVPFRTASGHIHIGWTEGKDPYSIEHQTECRYLVKQLDLHLGIPSTFLEGKDGPRRRDLYGWWGAYRPKPYGVEYRVLSNFWLKNDKFKRWVYNSVHDAYTSCLQGNFIGDIPGFTPLGADFRMISKYSDGRYFPEIVKERYREVQGLV